MPSDARSTGRATATIVATILAVPAASLLNACATAGDDTLDITPTSSSPVTNAPGADSPSTAAATTAAAATTTTAAAAATTTAVSGAPPPSTPVRPEGFTVAQAIITSPQGEVCEVCVWFADENAERGRGLMGVTDLGEAVGMVFSYAEDTTGSFVMFNTPTPLSIAWFGRDGDHLFETDMEPCLVEDSATCTRYNPGVSYAFALEVFQGDLPALGIGPGSNVQLVPGSEASSCDDLSI